MLRFLHLGVWILGSLLVTTIPAMTFECVDYARMGTMLGQIDKQCAGMRLTEAGKKVMIDMAFKAAPGGEACAAAGKASMLQELSGSFSELAKVAASGNKAKFTRTLCQSIAAYLLVVTNKSKASPLIEPAP